MLSSVTPAHSPWPVLASHPVAARKRSGKSGEAIITGQKGKEYLGKTWGLEIKCYCVSLVSQCFTHRFGYHFVDAT